MGNPHNLTLREIIPGQPEYHCEVCGRNWKKEPSLGCPGVKVYQWKKWPDHLMTKTQLAVAGYQTGKALPKPSGAVFWSKMPDGILWLYDVGQAKKRTLLTPEEKADRKAKTRQTQLCPRCSAGLVVWGGRRHPYCIPCTDEIGDQKRRRAVAEEFQNWLDRDCLILDTETTSLEGEIIEIAVIDSKGNVLINQRLNPRHPEEILASGAYHVHGIHPNDLGLCMTFHELYPQLWSTLKGRLVVIFNRAFDRARLMDDCQRWGLPRFKFKSECAMLEYSRYVGDWSDYWDNYRYQSLPSRDHSALGDCRATLELMNNIIDKELGNG